MPASPTGHCSGRSARRWGDRERNSSIPLFRRARPGTTLPPDSTTGAGAIRGAWAAPWPSARPGRRPLRRRLRLIPANRTRCSGRQRFELDTQTRWLNIEFSHPHPRDAEHHFHRTHRICLHGILLPRRVEDARKQSVYLTARTQTPIRSEEPPISLRFVGARSDAPDTTGAVGTCVAVASVRGPRHTTHD